MFERARLLGTDTEHCHPFLHRVFARTIPADTVEFYMAYLAERKAYLNRLLSSTKAGDINLPFVNRNGNKWRSVDQETLGDIYGERLAIELPRHLFDSDIRQHLQTLPQMSGVDFGKANVTYLIAEYMKRVLGDDFQNFYSLKRHYRYMDMLKGDTNSKGSLVSTYLTTEERERLWGEHASRSTSYVKAALKKKPAPGGRGVKRPSAEEREEALKRSVAAARLDYQKSEKVIRRYKVQDAMLFLMAKQALTETADFDGARFKLKEIAPDAEKGILSMSMPMKFTFSINGETYTITANSMKLKDYGNFFPLAADKRFKALMHIVGSNTVQMEKLSDEFKVYDQCRPEIVTLVLQLEERAYAANPALRDLQSASNRHGFAAVINELCNSHELSAEHGEVLRKIRNAFSHNSYPNNIAVEIKALPEVARSIKRIFEDYSKMK